MNIQLEAWHIISLMITVIGAAWAGFGVLLKQVDKRLDARFEAMEAARAEGVRHWDRIFGELADQHRREASELQRVENDFLRFQADLPNRYVMRMDYIRGQSVLEAKQDALAARQDAMSSKIDVMTGRIETYLKGENK